MRSCFQIIATTALFIIPATIHAQPMRTPIPVTVPVQGLLTDSNGVPLQSTQVSIQFRLYRTQVAANAFWTDTYTVRVGDLFPGVFSVSLGSNSSAPLTDEQLRDNNTPWLGMTVGSDSEMPRWALERTPFAAFSNLAGDSASGNGIPTGGIVLSENDMDTNLTNAGFTRLNYTVNANCDPGAMCGGTGSGSGGGNASRPNWGGAQVQNRASIPTQLIWMNGAGVEDGSCGNGRFYNYSRRKTPRRYCPDNDSWDTFPSAPGDYGNRYAFAAAGLKHSNGRHYFHVVGGNGPSRRHDYYSPQDGWSRGQDYPNSRYCLAGGVVKNKWYVFGGSSAGGNGSPVNTAYVYDPIQNSWSGIPNIASGTRVEHSVGAIGGKLYIVSGKVNNSRSSRVDIYDPDAQSYGRAADFPRAVLKPAGRGLGGRIVMHGGSGGNGSATGCGPCYNTYNSYNPDSNSWAAHGNGGSRAAGGTAFHAAGRLGDCVYVAGGEPWQTRQDRLCVAGAKDWDDAQDAPAVVLRAYRAP